MILFYAPQMEELARAIARYSCEQIDIIQSRGGSIELGKISWEKFDNQTPHTAVENAHRIRGQRVGFLASFDQRRSNCDATLPHAGFFQQMCVVQALPKQLADTVRVILPYFSFGPKDRADFFGDIVNAKGAARIISGIPACHGGGPPLLVTYDIHALQEEHYFGDGIIVDSKHAHALIRKEVEQTFDCKRTVIVFPDAGARKRYGADWADFRQVVCEKVRTGNTSIVRIAEGDAQACDALIVDDQFRTCGTTVSCADALIGNGARSVSAFAVHGDFSDGAWNKLTPDLFKTVYLTDSCPFAVNAVRNLKHFKVLSLAPMLAEDLTW